MKSSVAAVPQISEGAESCLLILVFFAGFHLDVGPLIYLVNFIYPATPCRILTRNHFRVFLAFIFIFQKFVRILCQPWFFGGLKLGLAS